MPTRHGRRKPINRRMIVLSLWDTGYPKRDFCITQMMVVPSSLSECLLRRKSDSVRQDKTASLHPEVKKDRKNSPSPLFITLALTHTHIPQ